MPLKLGIDASRANKKERTGVEKYCFQIIQHLKQVLPAEVQVILYSKTPLNYGLEQLPKNWKNKVLSWPGPLWTQVRLSLEMFCHSPDILFVPGHVFPFLHPYRTVLTIHDVAAAEFPQSYNFFERFYSLYPAKRSKALYKIITPSDFTKKQLQQHFSIDSSKIRVIPHGYIENCKGVQDPDVLNKYNVQQPFLLFLGRIETKKNVERIISAYNKLRSEKKLELVLAGKPGYGYKKIKQKINSSNYEEDIKELGWIDEQDKLNLISNSELLLIPSLYEGFGFPVLEAFDCETPVIASENTSLKEVGGKALFYVDPHSVDSIFQAIEKSLNNQKLRKKKIKIGRERLDKFSWHKAAKKTAKVLLS